MNLQEIYQKMNKLASMLEWDDERIKAAWKKTAAMSPIEYAATVKQRDSGYSSSNKLLDDAMQRQAEDTPENRESKKRYKDFLKNKFSTGSNMIKGT